MNLLRRSTSARRPLSHHRSRSLAVRLECLEDRTVLSTTIYPSISAYLATLTTSSDTTAISTAVTNPTPSSSAVTPSQLISAYGFSTSSTTGAGTTIAIVGAYNNPTIQNDLAVFSSYYHLAAASLTVVNQYGSTTNLPQTDAGWSLETAMDVEWAHAVAPGAKIVLVEANSSSVTDLMTAVQTASKLANVVSMSWGGSEWASQTIYDTASYFANSSVTFVAASGDDGGAYGAEWPASSPYVVSVGGTTLSSSGTETAWSASGSYWSGYSGSTGGVSRYESLPTYQVSALGSSAATGRIVPDVAADANPTTGVAIYTTVSGLGQTGWFKVGGTSAGAPVWAGLIADADAARFAVGKTALSSSQTLTLLYSQYGTSTSRSAYYTSYFTDITSGANYAGSAKSGYDIVTGLGSPKASAIWSAAAAYAGASTSVTTTTTTTTPIRVVPSRPPFRYRAVEDASSTTSTAEETVASTTTAVEIAAAAAQTAAATAPAQSAATASTVVSSSVDLTATATSAALPNQSLSYPVSWSQNGSETLGATESTPALPPSTPAAAVDQASTPSEAQPESPTPAPDRAPEDAVPAAEPVDQEALWDEALAGVRISRPAPADFGGRTSSEEEEAVVGAAPRMAAAFGAVAVLWHARRRRKADDRRRIVFFVPSAN
ncbi:hypothetical protein [Paludisphaera rhizosphaerae]|uniref:hypothetical protein n=1 Tax=Paludisphaera rhizosphaerae TaxID=2711216 RepID=UPI00197E9F7C|nr:hypothetical protein [Paludisphaera rhizosphaerae]